MKRRSIIQVSPAVRSMFLLILFLTLMTTISAGISICSGHSTRPRLLGWIILIASLLVAVSTVNAWSRILPGVLAVATLNGAILLSTGRALNQSFELIPRWESALFTVLMAGATATTLLAVKRKSTFLDRMAYLGVLGCFIAMLSGVMIPIDNWEIPTSIGFVAFITLLWVNTSQNHLVLFKNVNRR